MGLYQSIFNPLRISCFFCVLTVLLFTGTQDGRAEGALRIGLQIKQAEVKLQGTVPLLLTADAKTSIEIPAEQVIDFTASQDAIVVSNGEGSPLLTTANAVAISPKLGIDSPTPLIRLLGPTRHYDGKPDRPYRGTFEVSLRDGGLTVVNTIGVERYLYGVVSSEMGPSYPIEALKAQAIAARTYAMKNIGRCAVLGYDLDDTPGCQVYGGYFSEDPRTTQAVDNTQGMVLTYHGDLIDAVYSSTCGGFTESAASAWGRYVPYLQSVSDVPADMEKPVVHPTSESGWADYFKTAQALNCLQPKYAKVEAFRWVKVMTRQELETGLPADCRVGTIQDIIPLKRGPSGRIMSLRLVGSNGPETIEQELPIRKAFGKLRTSAFSVDIYRQEDGTPLVFVFWGAGWGHGLGMCQVGAVGLASQGWDYARILQHYYTGVLLEQR